MHKSMKQVTIQDVNAMSPEELEEFKRQASIAILKRMASFVILKFALYMLINRLAKRMWRDA